MIISIITKSARETQEKQNHLISGQVCIVYLTGYIEIWVNSKPENIRNILSELVNRDYYPILVGLPDGKLLPAHQFMENEIQTNEPSLNGPLLLKQECNGISNLLTNEKIQRIKIRKDGTIKIWLKEAVPPSEIAKEGIRIIKPKTIPPTINTTRKISDKPQ